MRYCWHLLFVALLLAMPAAQAQGWNDPGDEYDEEKTSDQNVGNTFVGLGDWFYQDFLLGIVKFGKGSWDRVSDRSRLAEGFDRADVVPAGKESEYPFRAIDIDRLRPRAFGEPGLPFIRLDLAREYENQDLFAVDARLELGYGPFAAQGRTTRYFGHNPDDIYEVHQWHALLRLCWTDDLEIDLGYGQMVLDGEDRDRNGSFCAGVLYYPTSWLGFELRGAWAQMGNDRIEDYDGAVLFRWQYTSLRLGYRKFNGEDGSYDGAYTGIGLHF